LSGGEGDSGTHYFSVQAIWEGNGVEELILSELLGKYSGDVQYLCICFLWEMRILGRI
jgi:hypothetical protein